MYHFMTTRHFLKHNDKDNKNTANAMSCNHNDNEQMHKTSTAV